MAKNLGSKCKYCRRAGEKLFLKGDRCSTPKCAMTRKPYKPGTQGESSGGRGRGPSEYGKQLLEKQKLRRTYGVSEKQFRLHLLEAQRQTGVVGDNLIARLETRMDNVIYRMGFAESRTAARQLVSHSMFLVNEKPLNIPSARIKIGDSVKLKPHKSEKKYFKELKEVLKKGNKVAGWLSFDPGSMEGKVLSKPKKDEAEVNSDVAAVIEFYSRS